MASQAEILIAYGMIGRSLEAALGNVMPRYPGWEIGISIAPPDNYLLEKIEDLGDLCLKVGYLTYGEEHRKITDLDVQLPFSSENGVLSQEIIEDIIDSLLRDYHHVGPALSLARADAYMEEGMVVMDFLREGYLGPNVKQHPEYEAWSTTQQDKSMILLDACSLGKGVSYSFKPEYPLLQLKIMMEPGSQPDLVGLENLGDTFNSLGCSIALEDLGVPPDLAYYQAIPMSGELIRKIARPLPVYEEDVLAGWKYPASPEGMYLDTTKQRYTMSLNWWDYPRYEKAEPISSDPLVSIS